MKNEKIPDYLNSLADIIQNQPLSEEDDDELFEGLVNVLNSLNQLDVAKIVAHTTFSNESGFIEYLNEEYEDIRREARVRKELEPFQKHQETCGRGCKFFPLGQACYQGAKLANPNLPFKTEAEYLEHIKESHKDCEYCNE